jgi:hypothetical protein
MSADQCFRCGTGLDGYGDTVCDLCMAQQAPTAVRYTPRPRYLTVGVMAPESPVDGGLRCGHVCPVFGCAICIERARA